MSPRSRARGGPNRRNQRKPRQERPPLGAGFWGDPAKLPPVPTDVRISDDPAAVVRSLGAPPLPGHEIIAEHYFSVVYDRAVALAGALAAAGGLIEPEELLED
jgi:hypothetical protein